MSGITGNRYGGSYEQMRDGIRNGTQDGNKIIRGDNNGRVGLHEGAHSVEGFFGRVTKERNKGSENVFNALSEKLGTETAKRIFSDIGLMKGDKFKELRVGDFESIDNRIFEVESGRLNLLSHNWQTNLPTGTSVPHSLFEEKTRDIVEREPDTSKIGYNDHNTLPEYKTTVVGTEKYLSMRDDVNDRMQTRVNRRLDEVSNGGRIVLGEGRIKEIIGEELKKIVDEQGKTTTTNNN